MNYLNKHGMRVVDLYRLIDTRRVGVLTRADFAAGITVSSFFVYISVLTKYAIPA